MAAFQNALEGVSLLVVLIISLAITFFGEPVHRGFWCNDVTIRNPYFDNTVTPAILAVLVVLCPTIIIFAFEKSPSWNYKSLTFYRQFFQKTYVFTFGFSLTYLMTTVAKLSIGRQRPNFMVACNPIGPNNTAVCVNSDDYVIDYQCRDNLLFFPNQEELSFFSGHASLSGS